MQEESISDNQGNWSEQNEKKRKRKSTVQIKLLKQELDGEMNWTKQKILKMAEVTGLSQSQVYKWCWDQKKKQNKYKQNSIYGGRRLIKKDISYRNYLPTNRNKQQDIENNMKDIENRREYIR